MDPRSCEDLERLRGSSERCCRANRRGGCVTVAPELAASLLARAARPDFARFEAQLRSSGYCARPVRLSGHIEICEAGWRRRVWSTQGEPDEILRKACGNRR